METPTEARTSVRSWWKLTLLVVVLGLGLGLAWHHSTIRFGPVIRQIEALNGRTKMSYAINTGIPWLTLPIGRLEQVDLLGPTIDDASLGVLEGTGRLRVLTLSNTRVTDKGLVKLARLRDLNQLYLANRDYTKVYGPAGERLATIPLAGGKGLAALEDLPDFQLLILEGPGTSDDDLQGLGKLKQLRKLTFYNTRVTEEGVAGLKKALPECFIIRKNDPKADAVSRKTAE